MRLYDDQVRLDAQQMRDAGATYAEITEQLGVTAGTLSYWFNARTRAKVLGGGTCADCGATIGKRWTRCKTCSNRSRMLDAPAGFRVCMGCRRTLPLTDFGLNGSSGRASRCRACRREETRQWHLADRARRYSVAAIEDVIDSLVVLERADGMCGICGEDVDPLRFDIDHIVALRHGGTHTYGNVQATHPSCNRRKAIAERHAVPDA